MDGKSISGILALFILGVIFLVRWTTTKRMETGYSDKEIKRKSLIDVIIHFFTTRG